MSWPAAIFLGVLVYLAIGSVLYVIGCAITGNPLRWSGLWRLAVCWGFWFILVLGALLP